ncbi:NitT/TauT family transport system permease protein OS=Castellaniella defragrans OX=75697 GN=HNR28_003476 PE=3 SV=1 [Castellaniella defragrans]
MPAAGRERRLGLSPGAWMTAGALAILLFLEFGPRSGLVDTFTLPPLSTIVVRAVHLLFDLGFWRQYLGPSLLAIVVAFLLAAVGGVLLGLILWRFRLVRRMFDPWLSIYYAIPTFALYPLLVVLAGIGLVPVILLGTLLAIVSVITATLDGLDSIPPITIKLANALQLSTADYTFKILVPSTLNQIVTGLRLALSFSIIGVMASEFILSTYGLGYFISYAYDHFSLDDMYAGIGIILFFALGANFLFGLLLRTRSMRIFER